MPFFRNNDESRPIISLGRRSGPYSLYSDSEDDIEEIEFEKAVFERQCLYEPSRTHKHRVRRLLFCLLIGVFITILVTVLYYYFTNQFLERWRRIEIEELKVKIDGGYINGVQDDNVFVFRGIPYATAPVGELRWQHPKRCSLNACWNGTFQAADFGEQCVQVTFNKNGSVEEVDGNENCLFINVWSPITAHAENKLPVMVYVHGGGLISSSGNAAGLHPTTEFVKEMQVVAVSFNYRLNAFGFLALKVLSENSNFNTSGDYGFMDQILALQWIQNNIDKFGGDPRQVTLLGQSSGGTSILALMASPLAKGLFHRAIAMSPSSDIATTVNKASLDNKVFLTNSNCTGESVQCLYDMNAREVVNAVPWNVYPSWSMAGCYDLPTKGKHYGGIAVVDGYVLPESPVVAIKSRNTNDVPLIIGSTAQEIGAQPNQNFAQSSMKSLKKYVRDKLGPFIKSGTKVINNIFELYDMELKNASAQYVYTTLASDIREVCPVEYLSLIASKHFPVYRYIVTNTPSRFVTIPTATQNYEGPQYSFRMWDLIAFFGFPKPFKYKPTMKDKAFMQNLRDEFQHFIHSGKVKSEHWMKHINRTALFSNDGLEIMPGIYHNKQCMFWLKYGFSSYAWIN